MKTNISLLGLLCLIIIWSCKPKKPIANYTMSNNPCQAPCQVSFTSTSNGDINHYKWNFGDNTAESNEASVSHLYERPGTYNVSLQVTGPGGSDIKRDTVRIVKDMTLPIASFRVENNNCHAACEIKFIDQSSNGISYFWEFGDGESSSEQNPTHTYCESGSFSVKLTIQDNQGRKDNTTMDVTIDQSLLFSKTFGGTEEDRGVKIISTSDGGYAILGITQSFGAGNRDVYFARTDAQGNLLVGYPRTYGNSEDDACVDIIQTKDGGYAMIGTTTDKNGRNNVLFIRTDSEGNVLAGFPKNYGNEQHDHGMAVVEIDDGSFAIVGLTYTFAYTSNILFLKTDSNGNLLANFPKEFSLGCTQWASDIIQLDNGNLMIGASIKSCAPSARSKGYTLEVNHNGNIINEKMYEFSHNVISILKNGNKISFIGGSSGGSSLWSTDFNGNLLSGFPKSFSGSLRAFQKNESKNLILVGSTSSTQGEVYLAYTDENGNLLSGFPKTFGEQGNQEASDICIVPDKGFAILGTTDSEGAGKEDILLIKGDKDGNIN